MPFQDKEQACLLFAIKAASAPGSVYVSKMKSIWALCTAPGDSQDKGNSYNMLVFALLAVLPMT